MMKKSGTYSIFAVTLVLFAVFGCNSRDFNEPVWTSPTFTPTPAGNLYIVASVASSSTDTIGVVAIVTGSSSGSAVSGATVTMNGQTLTSISPGSYINVSMPAISPGTAVALVITSSSGNATGSVTMPSTGTNTGTITGGSVGSSYTASYN